MFRTRCGKLQFVPSWDTLSKNCYINVCSIFNLHVHVAISILTFQDTARYSTIAENHEYAGCIRERNEISERKQFFFDTQNCKYIRVGVIFNSTEYNITDNLRSLTSLNKFVFFFRVVTHRGKRA